MNSDVEMARVVQDANFGFFRARLRFERFALPEVGDNVCRDPERIIEGAVEEGRAFHAGGGGDSGARGRGLGAYPPEARAKGQKQGGHEESRSRKNAVHSLEVSG